MRPRVTNMWLQVMQTILQINFAKLFYSKEQRTLQERFENDANASGPTGRLLFKKNDKVSRIGWAKIFSPIL
ncbi:hypothetical protein T02_4130 [Trichinella nativa]|uniref:Uncharacterized protein n=1 Tax=Trichinella nativa TaxID=6335 RepID=A0A0V1L6F0_9BILA|nr:hypothetical protein T06_14910 [Trichinella sp. T6]KRZ55114.1 hypothetical protein T02_4130 [Trichinella nativa]